MIAIISGAAESHRKRTAAIVIEIMNKITESRLSSQLQELERLQHLGLFYRSALLDQQVAEVKRQKSFYAGLHTHEQRIRDFLLYRATSFTPSAKRWTWSPEDDVPETSSAQAHIPMLPDIVTQIPDELRCPISQDIMVDAVKAGDGQIYSRHALRQWFTIRKSSPLHGTTLRDTSMV